MRNTFFWFFLIPATIVVLCRCDMFDPGLKALKVDGHHKFKQGALHKDEPDEPFGNREHEGCASDNCHQSDLKGGLTSESHLVAPSCFQCHGPIWEEDEEDEEDDH
ncbi:MAG: hypothetical protein HQK83_04785 [Fibrobacteria bacterium]|nr:hypothetical protein [Fibrobacteria bacterium]